MSQLVYSREQLLAEHEHATAHVECGHRLHGGFDAGGDYQPPRSLHREPAIRAWRHQLERRDVVLLEPGGDLLHEPHAPTVAQQVLLLRHGIEASHRDALTLQGLEAARDRQALGATVADLGAIVEDDLTGTALGHLPHLLDAQALDRGGDASGDPAGGHELMWYTVRELVHGEVTGPLPEGPSSADRPRAGREMPAIPEPCEDLLLRLVDLAMRGVRARQTFDFHERVLGHPEVFTGRRTEAGHAAALVGRIRRDVALHVAALTTALSEFRACTVIAGDGTRMRGADLLDPVWQRSLHWHGVEWPAEQRAARLADLREEIRAASGDGDGLLEAFDALD